MNKYKIIFKKFDNDGTHHSCFIYRDFLINIYSSKNNISENLGGSFLLKDHKGDLFDSKKIQKKINLFWIYILS